MITLSYVDVAIDRKSLEKVAAIASKYGFRYADGAWTADQPRNAVHFLFIGEKARPNQLEHPTLAGRPTDRVR